MSRRKRRAANTKPRAPGRAGGADARGAPSALGGADAGTRRSPREGAARGLAEDIGILAIVYAVTVAIAELAGAANLGVALGTGQVAFVIVLAVLLVRR